jgi:nitrogenase subunit NifH
MEFDPGTIKHLGLQMYSTLPPVIGELVSNAWDADATRVDIQIPTKALTDKSEIIVTDNGVGMSDGTIRQAYLIVGRDRRQEDKTDETPGGRKVMGRKGIGKFSAFGIAGEIEIETVHKREVSRFVMSQKAIEESSTQRKLEMPVLKPTGIVKKGTRVVMRGITKFRTKCIAIDHVRRELARRFSIIGAAHGFQVRVNHSPITAEERDLKRLLERDVDGQLYLWDFKDEEIKPNTGWRVSGWIGALKHTKQLEDGIQRGVVIMARGKLVQAPFVFDAVVGQQYAFSYIVGEIHAEFVDEGEDTISTARNSLVWDTPANAALKEWGMRKVNDIARMWSERRRQDNERKLAENPLYKKFTQEADQYDDKAVKRIADRLIKNVIADNPIANEKSQEQAVQMCLDFMQFNAFAELAREVGEAKVNDVGKLLDLFREWEVVEAKEMMRVTEGRIKTIEKLAELIRTNSLEVPTLHNFLKEFPWVLDPRWTLVADEKRFSQLLRKEFPQEAESLETDRRIDFLCVRESTSLVVVEIKRPQAKAAEKQLRQIETYVNFMREHVERTTDADFRFQDVVGYLLCGDVVNTGQVRGVRQNLEHARIFVRRYQDLLRLVEANHKEFLSRYDDLRKAKAKRSEINVKSK